MSANLDQQYPENKILTVPEVAKILRISKSKVYALIAAGKLPHYRIVGNVRISANDLMHWLQNQKVEQKE